ncbi:Myb-like DNA-binding domain containing protein [Tritrichomonas foetus]|uniref:Myb-like DNA-binding domain containing protein n=1 Tax=Tritrichomonas foetus TaxID=1144522 RepID=A0A1J4L5U6_9EUKA|nr:Myb-like DNA-binding domain containing protein [Tritrichomonas foetus]|eukprot:OHT17317.1 Myb-like DNA-binding domain containing protein [Tritrichomonas foetus]
MKAKSSGRSHPRSGFTSEEDCLLVDLVAQFGDDNWSTIASYMEKRNARQCKDRYMSYLSPTINNGPYSEEEDCLLRQKYQELGPKWVKISKFFPNRTDISVKCRWAVLNRRDLKNKEKRRADSQTPSQSVKNINPKENTRYNTTNNNNNINRDNIIYNTRSKSWNCKNVNQNFYFNGSSYSNNSSCTNNLNNSKSKNSVYVFDSDYESDSYYDNDNENSFEEIQKEAIQQNNNTQGMESNSSIYFNHQNIQMNEIQKDVYKLTSSRCRRLLRDLNE